MCRNGGGIIINVSSMVTRIATRSNGGYRATKMALDSLSDAIRLELREKGIRVVTVYPGLTKSDFFSIAGKHSQSASANKFRYTPEQVAAA
jgi:short-subunit dehydrogenase